MTVPNRHQYINLSLYILGQPDNDQMTTCESQSDLEENTFNTAAELAIKVEQMSSMATVKVL